MKSIFLSFMVLILLGSINTSKLNAQTGAALNFDGVDDYATINGSTMGALTVEFWMRTTQTGGTGTKWFSGTGIIDADVSGVTNDLGISLLGDKIAFGVGNPDVTITSTTSVNTGNWVHVCAMYTSNPGGSMWLYINGILEAQKLTGVGGSARNLNNGIVFGRIRTAPSGTYYNGDLDEVRVWDKVLSNCELQSTMNCEVLPPNSHLWYYYQFNQGIAGGNNTGISTATNLMGGNNATLNNFTRTSTSSNFVAPGSVASGVTCISPTVEVTGNSNSISDGATTTSTTNATNFGNVCINGGSTTRVYSIQNSGTDALTLGSFTLSGSGASSFSVTALPNATISASSNSTFAVTFTPTVLGSKTATLSFSTNDCAHLIYSYRISATTVGAPTVAVNSGSICSGNSFIISPTGATSYTFSSGSATVSPITTTSYTVIGSDANGCFNSNAAISTVSVTTSPTVSLSGTSICLGNSYTLSPSGASSYTISGGNTVVSPTTTTTYTVIGSNGACLSQNTASATVVVISIPSASITASQTVFCLGDNAVLSTNLLSGETVKWYKNGSLQSGQTNPTFTVSQSGNYTAVITNSNSCSATSNVISILVNSLPVASISSSAPNFCPGISTVTLTATSVGGATYAWLYNGNPISGANTSVYSTTTTGQYQVVVTNTNNCTNTSTVTTLQTATVQTFTLTSPSSTFCAGSSTSIDANLESGSTYAWYKNGSAYGTPAVGLYSVSPTSAGDYYVKVTNTFGCISISNTITLTVKALPTASISATALSVCSGDSVLITAASVSGATYEWFKNNISQGAPQLNNTSFYGKPTNSYKVVVDDGCNATSNVLNITQKSLPSAAGSVSGTNSFCPGETNTYNIGNVSGASSYVWSIVPSNAASIASGQGSTSVDINTTNQNFTVSVMPQNSCGNGTASSFAVTLNSGFGACSGAIYFAANKTNVCTGNTVVFTNYSDPNLSPGLTQKWNFGTGASPATATGVGPHSVTYSSTGLKTVTLDYVDAFNNVFISDTKNNYVNVSSAPITSSITGNQTVTCNASTEVYQVVNTIGSTYNWTVPSGATIVSGQGSNAIVVNFGGNAGNISVTETNTGGCNGASVTLSVSCSVTTGITDNEQGLFKIYPNPVQDRIYIATENQLEVTVIITDVAGREIVNQKETINKELTYDVSSFVSGIYFIKLVTNNNIHTTKIIKQ